MFVTVKGLTAYIDINLKYVKEAYDNKGNFEEEVFDEYIKGMSIKLNRQIEKLKEISCNRGLIDRYEKKVNELFK